MSALPPIADIRIGSERRNLCTRASAHLSWQFTGSDLMTARGRLGRYVVVQHAE
jgi:hypothetical protein